MTSMTITSSTTVLSASLTHCTAGGAGGTNGAGGSVRERLARRVHELTFGVPMLLVLTAVLRGYLHPQGEDDEGASTAEWVIGVAIAATLAIAVGAIIVSKVTAKANSIDLG